MKKILCWLGLHDFKPVYPPEHGRKADWWTFNCTRCSATTFNVFKHWDA